MATETTDTAEGYDAGQFPAFAVTVDVVILTMSESMLHVLLVKRGVEPFKGSWAIPGGFKLPVETLDEAARRELVEETGVDVATLLTQFGAYGDPGRDPRMNVVTVAYLAVLRDVGPVVAGSDAAEAALLPVADLLSGRIDLAFDHLRIVCDAVERVRVDLETTGLATSFVGPTFTLADLRAVFEAVWGIHLDSANFRRSVAADAGWVIPTGRRVPSGSTGGKPAELFRSAGPGSRAGRSGDRGTVSEGSEAMRAVVHERYGTPDVLRLAEVAKPEPSAEEVLVRVHAATVNRTDCGFRSGKPQIVRLFSGLLKPRRQILGSEFAGVVEAVGSSVTSFAVGDRVFGVHADRFGAHAEYLCVRDDRPIATMSQGMSFAEAASLCDGFILAASILRSLDIGPTSRLMIYGASGAIGTAAVQYAKHLGAEVTAVCNTPNVELVRSLGADHVIDYLTEDFTAGDETYDAVFDAVGKESFSRCKPLLKTGGTFACTDLGDRFQNPVLVLLTTFSNKKVKFPIPKYTAADVVLARDLFDARELKAVIDRTYPLDDVVEATRYVETEQKVGNVVINVTP